MLATISSRKAIVGVALSLLVGASIPAGAAGSAAGPVPAGSGRASAPNERAAIRASAPIESNPGRASAPAETVQLSAVATLPDLSVAALQNSRLPGSITNDRNLMIGGVGSDLWRSPSDPQGEYWMVTDRGPNDELKVEGENRRTFPVPEYTPLIFRVRVDGTTVSVLDTIPIVGQSGRPVTGLPNVEGHEAPYDASGETRLANNPSGLDVEGLVRTASGDFWIVEEYGPSLVHLDAGGKVLRRFVPEGSAIQGADYPVSASLPGIFGLRTPNRGFEGLTLSPDGSTLYLAIQSPLSNPDASTATRSRVGRVLSFDIAAERVTAEYAYPMGWPKEAKERKTKTPKADAQAAAEPKPARVAKPGRAEKPERPARPDTIQTRVSGLAPVGSSGLMVLERTGEDARLYLVDLSTATNLIGSRWDDRATTPSLEATSDPSAEGLALLTRTLLADLSTIPEVPEKIEGIAILDPTTVALANDNDFDIGKLDLSGNNVGEGRKSQIITVTLPRPLW
jgi:hypothetical protein